MAHYDFEVFKACNKKYHGYGHSTMRIESVNTKTGMCKVARPTFEGVKHEDYAIEQLVNLYITSTSQLPYITNPSAIKGWRGFYTFKFDETAKHDIEYMLLGLREQYTSITKGIGAVKCGLTYDLKLKGKVVEFSGMMSDEIPFKKKEFKIEGKDLESLKNEIKGYLFDTLDGFVNLC